MTKLCVYCGSGPLRSDRSIQVDINSDRVMCSTCAADRRGIPHDLYVQVILARHEAEGERLRDMLLGDADQSHSAAPGTGDAKPKPKSKPKPEPVQEPKPEPVQEPEPKKKWEPYKVNGRVVIMSGPLENGEEVQKGEGVPDPTCGQVLYDTVWKFFDDDPDEETLAAEAEWEVEQIRKHEERAKAPKPEGSDVQDILAEWDE